MSGIDEEMYDALGPMGPMGPGGPGGTAGANAEVKELNQTTFVIQFALKYVKPDDRPPLTEATETEAAEGAAPAGEATETPAAAETPAAGQTP